MHKKEEWGSGTDEKNHIHIACLDKESAAYSEKNSPPERFLPPVPHAIENFMSEYEWDPMLGRQFKRNVVAGILTWDMGCAKK